MSLVFVSDREGKRMKRVFAAVLVFAVLLTAAACAKSGESAWREDCAAIPVIRERYRADLALMEHDIDEVPMCGVRIRNRDNIDDYVVAIADPYFCGYARSCAFLWVRIRDRVILESECIHKSYAAVEGILRGTDAEIRKSGSEFTLVSLVPGDTVKRVKIPD